MIGPRVQVLISPLEAQIKALTEKGQIAPQPVVGWALIDTGASSTCLDEAAATKAGLATVDSGPMTSATHANQIVPIVAGRVEIPGMAKIDVMRAYACPLATQGLVALIGRDLLSRCLLVYNGPDGSMSLSV